MSDFTVTCEICRWSIRRLNVGHRAVKATYIATLEAHMRASHPEAVLAP